MPVNEQVYPLSIMSFKKCITATNQGNTHAHDSNAIEGISSCHQDQQINPINTIVYDVIL